MASLVYFDKLDFRMGKITEVINTTFRGDAAFKITLDFGSEIGIKTTIVRLTESYGPTGLKNKCVVCIINLPPQTYDGQVLEVFMLGMANPDGRESLLESDSYVSPGGSLEIIE